MQRLNIVDYSNKSSSVKKNIQLQHCTQLGTSKTKIKIFCLLDGVAQEKDNNEMDQAAVCFRAQIQSAPPLYQA